MTLTERCRYVRGSEQDYDDWAAITGDSTWHSKHMKEYMKKHQTLEPISDKVLDRTAFPFVGENHGTSGPVRTSFNDNAMPIENEVILAADEACGFSKKPVDPWSGDHIGFYNTLGTVIRTGPNKGKRSYAGRGYFEANAQRSNLRLTDESTVARVILTDGAATGVEYLHGGQKYKVKAKREVIVCGGTIASPQMLELSGIGDRKVLEAAGVECLVELPSVGTDFQDHQLVFGSYRLKEGVPSADAIYRTEVMEAAQKALMETQGGPLTNISCVQGFFPVKLFLEDGELEEIIRLTEETKVESDYQRRQLQQFLEQIKSDKSANMQLVFVPATAAANGDPVSVIHDQSKIFGPINDPYGPSGVTFALCLQYGASRGRIHIKSSDPFEHPQIDPGYITHEADVILLGAAFKFVDKLVQSSHIKDLIAAREWPKPEVDITDKMARREAVREAVMGEYHVCGSCAMGHTVDSRLRVNGVKNLRVADASVFPGNVSGNIVSSVYSVAEKAADIIKADWDHAALKKVTA
jgi:choline dehydrogenase-like flavoprotein